MRRLFLVITIVVCFIGIHAQSPKILFLGNSYTSVNNLPDIVKQIYAAAGETVSVSMIAPGGFTFQQHCTSSMGAIQSGDYDYVVLQEQSQQPAFPEFQFMQQSYPYAHQLCDAIRLYRPDAQIAFYMTWGRKNGDQQNCAIFPPLCTYEGMDSLLYARYMMMSEDNLTCVSPVGAAWHYVRDHYPDIDLYQSDESHPAYIGSYIAACCFYTLFSGRNPMEITWNGTLDEGLAGKAKFAVKSVVYDSLPKWCFHGNPVPDDSTSVISYETFAKALSVFPNPVSHSLRWSFNSNARVETLTIYDLTGRVVYQIPYPDSSFIDVSFLENGFYLLAVFDGKRRYQTQFSIVH